MGLTQVTLALDERNYNRMDIKAGKRWGLGRKIYRVRRKCSLTGSWKIEQRTLESGVGEQGRRKMGTFPEEDYIVESDEQKMR